MLRQLKKKDDHKEPNNNSSHLDDDALVRRLMIQSNSTTTNGRKRASDESDDSASGTKQRPTDQKRPSELQAKNKMLASLLAEPTKPPIVPCNLPIRIIPDIPQQHSRPPAHPSLQISSQNNSSTIFKNNVLKNPTTVKQIRHQQPLRNNNSANTTANAKPSDNSSIYLNQLQQHPNPQSLLQSQQMLQQQRSIEQQRNVNSLLTTSTTSAAQSQQQGNENQGNSFANTIQQFILSSSSNSVTTTAITPSQSQPSSEWDSELNDILEKVIDFVPETNYGADMNSLLNSMDSASQSKQQEEINKIQQSLMQCEDEAFGGNSPPAYPLHALSAQQQIMQQRRQATGFSQPPPVYAQRNVRLPMQQQMNSTVASPTPNNQQASNKLSMMQMQIQDQLFQQQQKKRLLQQQQNQQMVVPVNATAGADQLCEYFIANPIES